MKSMDFFGGAEPAGKGVAGNSDSMLSACVTVCACKRRCALQGRGGAMASYGDDEQRRQTECRSTEKDAISCRVPSEDWDNRPHHIPDKNAIGSLHPVFMR